MPAENFVAMKRLAIFASGGGSNAEKIMEFFSGSEEVSIDLIVSNNSDAGVLSRAEKFGVDTFVHSADQLQNDELTNELLKREIDFVVLAGYLKKISQSLLDAYPNRIVNIHPALLPKFGGKGMYGMNAHKAVVESGESESGMTIHYVNENYDEGAIIEQHRCEVLPNDTAEELAARVLRLEHQFFAPCIGRLLKQ